MAEDPAPDERTEAPTARRREEARRQGNLWTSRELPAALAGAVTALWLLTLGPALGHRLAEMMASGLAFAPAWQQDVPPPRALLTLAAPLAWPLAALAIGALLAAVLARAAVGGLVFAPRLLEPRVDRLDPWKGLGRLFGPQGLVELVKALAKGALILGAGAGVLWQRRTTLMNLAQQPLEVAFATVLETALLLVLVLTLGLALVAAVDLPIQFFRWLAGIRMTRRELKDELRQTEGSPEARAALRRARHRLLKEANRRAVAEAGVVLVNPVQFAIALRYRVAVDPAPVVVARGRGPVAAAIRELADELGIPVLAYPEVARALYFTCRVGQTIRPELYVVVATILAFVLRLSEGRTGPPPEVEVPEGYRFDAEGRRIG
ncbi:MAG: EscU/YscU/HrcU family type III secretion system export apparatus switch protein [Sphingomonadaceae bacterium]|uniref:EscU/YscU/HrcU family type III secretion system export apparatus switch protein n=1 Tax=Thermaurantiacus sp. TaxID=2820283 RepID=UPI00298EF76C|nr:EscU/YscU/HrcU family type III secretion system export apparatus switch protein [Thermaurantiacus sp.]MCS6987000.1 EscU/YscU/HrcU family type III secretion system export apparatus switch protein [Sphingomonadaceae bacterium]MDW8415662.1 EscU/YscU/HrcU family type III secretion system export apparatus switch protein [Thermaurantiacus sp.]